MSNHIGKLPIEIPIGVSLKLLHLDSHKQLLIETPKKVYINITFPNPFNISILNNCIHINLDPIHQNEFRAEWGSLQSRIKAILTGINIGYSKKISVKGSGYRFEPTNILNKYTVYIGFTSPIQIEIPKQISCKLLQNNTILEGTCSDLQLLTNTFNKIRLLKPAAKSKYKLHGFILN